MEAYGIAVRAGVLTPQLPDEVAVRKLFGLPAPSADVASDWKRTDGVRKPITIAKEEEENTPSKEKDNEQD